MGISALMFAIVATSAVVPDAKAETPVKGGTVVYLSSKIPSLNPLHSAYEVGLVTSQIFASLVRMDENNEIAPYLAESWKISDDGKTYTFNLAKNAKFHDGSPGHLRGPGIFFRHNPKTSSLRQTNVRTD